MRGHPSQWGEGRDWFAAAPHFGGAPSSTTSTQTTQPWAGQQPYLNQLFQDTSNTLNTGFGAYGGAPQYYPYSTYVPMQSYQDNSLNQMIGFGQNGGSGALQGASETAQNLESPGYTGNTSGAFNAGQNLLTNEINGNYLNPNNNPGFSTVVNNTLAATMPSIQAGFNGGNRLDSGLATEAASQGANNAIGNLELSNYQNERGLQQQAAQQAASNQLTQQQQQVQGMFAAPGIDQATLGDMQAGFNAGGQYQNDAQNALNADVNRWNYNQALPWNTLGLYGNLINGTYGSASSMTSPYYSNPTANILGAATGTMGLASGAGDILGASGAMGTSGLSGLGALAGFIGAVL